jgi:DNA polymerase I-like protein with 3'-5' exonuclease and polymerase domains
MRWRGILIDQDKAGQTSEQLKVKEKEVLKEVKRLCGLDIEVWASASVAKGFDKLGISYPRTARTNAPSFTSQWLETHDHELPKAIVRARKLNKIRTTFIDKMVFEHLHKGRLHAQINPLRSDNGGTVTGRFSYSTPNLQQVPARDPELGELVRELFVADGDAYWGAFDYSQQEPRLTVHYSSLTKQAGAGEAVKAYQDEDADFHQIVADMAGIDRKKAKMINLGLSYGMGRQKLTMSLGISEVEAEQLFASYHKRVPFIRGLTNACMRKASNKGFITTLLGRKCRFNLYEPQGERGIPLPYDQAVAKWGEQGLARAYTYKALNRLIQGSAADMTKRAMLDLWNEGYVPYVQVHDELDLAVSSKKEAENIKEIMEQCVKLQVPNIVDAEIGKSWGKATQSYQEVFK